MACGVMLVTQRPQIRRVIGTTIRDATDVVDLRRRLAAELAAAAVTGEDRCPYGPDGPRGRPAIRRMRSRVSETTSAPNARRRGRLVHRQLAAAPDLADNGARRPHR